MMRFTHGNQHSANIHDEPDKSKFMDWMETNKQIRKGVNLKSLIRKCCAVRNFVWNPLTKTWSSKFEI